MAIIKQKITIYLIITTFLFLIRMLLFINQYGGIEFDSGWNLGVAKNLSLRGIYASYTNTIVEEEKGSFPSIHGRFSVQDERGFIYFPAAVSIGPGYILPEALVLKILGQGFWQYRLWPIITFTALILVFFYLVYTLGGFLPLIVFQIWLWCIPQLYVNYSFEAFSESISLLYLLISILLIYKSDPYKRNGRLIFLSGLFLGLSISTKMISAITIVAFLPIALWEVYQRKSNMLVLSVRWLSFLLGVVSPIILFNLYQYFSIVSMFDPEGFVAIRRDFELNFRNNGSGIQSIGQLDWSFTGKKISLWSEIGIRLIPVYWLLFVLSPFILWRFLQKEKRILIALLYLSSISILGWFVFIAPTGWVRYAWIGIPQTMILSMISISYLTKIAYKKLGTILCILILITSMIFLIRFDKINPNFFLGQKDIDSWRANRYENGIQGLPSITIFSLSDQKDLLSFLEKNILEHDRIYYLDGFISPEVSTIFDKVLFSIRRFENLKLGNPDGGKSFLVFGPYQQRIESLVSQDYLENNITKYCKQVLFSNSSYKLCILKDTATGLLND